ncbi:MAG: thioredoxin-disulfide reductase [Planctomycetota bacterium]|jgi:thioredoxin reductase (NADPH)|nr:thioredoxin-disulfide reductase [Planctomycetota bacterium]
MTHNVAIIGSGPAGYTAALYTARAGLNPIIFEGMQPGGQLTITTEVENYPGFPAGVEGPELMEKFKAQCARFGMEFVEFNPVKRIDTSKRPYVIEGEMGGTWEAHSIIIATGASARLLGHEKETGLMGYGLSACATCDGAFFKDKEVVVVGAGDTAMEEATFLTRFATKVTVVHRRDVFRASKVMHDRAKADPKIEWKLFRQVTDFMTGEDKKINAVLLEDPRDGSTEEFACGGVFVAIGHTPNTGFLGDDFKKDDVGYLLLEDGTKTGVDGIFAAGDVSDAKYRQAITAAGAGCAAALDAQHWLQAEGLG